MNYERLELRWEKHNTSVMVAVHGTSCAIPPRNSNSNQARLFSAFFLLQCGDKMLWKKLETYSNTASKRETSSAELVDPG
jgi:hypothetical protein